MHPIVGPAPPSEVAVDVPLLLLLDESSSVDAATWVQSYEKPPLPSEVVHRPHVQFEPPYETEHPSSVPVASISAFTHSVLDPDPSQSETAIRSRPKGSGSAHDNGGSSTARTRRTRTVRERDACIVVNLG
jgi:hypothetical protein